MFLAPVAAVVAGAAPALMTAATTDATPFDLTSLGVSGVTVAVLLYIVRILWLDNLKLRDLLLKAYSVTQPATSEALTSVVDVARFLDRAAQGRKARSDEDV